MIFDMYRALATSIPMIVSYLATERVFMDAYKLDQRNGVHERKKSHCKNRVSSPQFFAVRIAFPQLHKLRVSVPLKKCINRAPVGSATTEKTPYSTL